jgi:hypothetical protein
MRKQITVAFIVLFNCWLLSADCKAQAGSGLPTLSKEQWREDLQYLARELPKRHKNLFHTVSREQFERAVADLDRDIPSLQDHQIIVRMLQITAMVGDAHTYVHLPPFNIYPLVLYWFGNELRVVRAAPEYKQALGARVVKAGGMAIEDVNARVRTLLSRAENEWFFLNGSPVLMTRPAVLHSLGILPEAGRATFTFEDERGRQFTLDVDPVPPDPAINSRLLGVSQTEPLFRQRQAEPFWFTYLPESQTVYANFKSYDSLGDNVRKVFQLVDGNPAQKLVIDMRQNGGGDFTKVRGSLIPEIKKRAGINKKGHLFVIIGRRTFSAAMTNAIDFRKETNAILVGEPAGERPNSYQENDELKLPNSRLTVSYSTRYYKFLDEEVPAVMPDKRIDPAWPDYKAGRDPVMDWILSYNPE